MKKWTVKKGALTVNGIPLIGLKKGDFITAKYNDARHTTHMSCDNVGRHAENINKDGTVGIGIAEGSPATSVMQALVDTGEPLIIAFTDFSSPGAFVLAEDAVIETDPGFIRSAGLSDVDWVFTVTNLEYKHASAAPSITP